MTSSTTEVDDLNVLIACERKNYDKLKVKLVDCLEREYDGGENKQSLALRDDQRVEMLAGSFHINYLSNGCNAATAFQLPS